MITSKKLTTTISSIIAGDVSQSVAVTTVYLCNSTSNVVLANLAVVPSGRTDAGNCLIYNRLEIPGLDTRIIDAEKLILGAGDGLWASCNVGNVIIMTVSSVGI